MTRTPSFFLIAGETSGDQLGGWLMAALKRKLPLAKFNGIGGPMMSAQGLTSLLPMREISLMGFAEILPHIFNLKRRIRETIEAIERAKPEMLITIDSPGFVTRVVRGLRARGIHRPKLVHYVAPSVWAYKPERAGEFAGLFDYLLCLLPFEPPYFDAVKLKNRFIGHEIAWWWKTRGDGAAFRTKHGLGNDPILAVFPGSRNGEITRLWPIFYQSIWQLLAQIPNLHIVVQVPTHMLERVRDIIPPSTRKHFLVIPNTEDKKNFFAAATAAIAKSGTIGLECALAGVPNIIAYRANPISAFLIRRMIRVKYVNLPNILADRMIVPELLQEHCTADAVAQEILPLLVNETARQAQRHELSAIASQLCATDSESPSDKAAAILVGMLA